MGPATRSRVRRRAGNRCEYCHLHQDDSPLAVLHVEHIGPKCHGGNDSLENLALACSDCNLHKGTNYRFAYTPSGPASDCSPYAGRTALRPKACFIPAQGNALGSSSNR